MREAPCQDTEVGKAEGCVLQDSCGGQNIFGTVGRATDFFVAPKYREYQRETIEEIESAFEQGYKYILLDAPTGSGKSHIARALAFQSGNTHILTIQKLLQDQYERDFEDMFIMKGRSEYRCLRSTDDATYTCANGPCRDKKSEACVKCPYKEARRIANDAPVTVHNFDSFYYQNVFAGAFKGRKLLIVDEAHNISGKFLEFLSFTLDSRTGVMIPRADSVAEYQDFVSSTLNDFIDEHDLLTETHAAVGLSGEMRTRMEDLGMLIIKMKWFMKSRTGAKPMEYVFDYSSSGRHGASVTFRPVFSGEYARRWLFGYGERVLMMSATILDQELFCWETGLDPKEVYYISVPSTFPAENRPIVKKYAGSMSYNDIDKTLPKIVELVQEIADKFPGRRGIVQTHSDKIATYLQENLDDPRFTYNRNFNSPRDMLAVHASKPGSIIVASGLREGIDLRGDLSQIQIFCKIPYPSLGDKVVKRKLELNQSWYGWVTTAMFLQSLGRSVRSSSEKAVTYILDSGFGFFYTKNKKFIPDYIKEAIKW